MVLKKICRYIVFVALAVMFAQVCYAEPQPLPQPLGALTKEEVLSQY